MTTNKPAKPAPTVLTDKIPLADLQTLATFLTDSGLEEIELELGEGAQRARVRLKRPGHAPATQAVTISAPTTQGSSLPVVTLTSENPANAFTSPMVGTFYQSASPDSAPFVKVGDTVKPGQTLCIIEAMKTMNQIEADRAGTIQKILATNATPVEYGQPLFVIA